MSTIKILSRLFVMLFTLGTSQMALAEAGRVIFAYGDVIAVSEDGESRKLTRRSQVEAGDTIRTASGSMMQMRMIDKAFIALRSNSEFKIESYRLGASKEEDTGIFSLLKGGFRAVTGIIGKRLRSAYKMRTVNATIGIRGTDYSARLCNNDCNQAFGNLRSTGNIADGLYVGVNDGGINLTNQLGTLDLDELQFGYVKDATSAPVALLTAPEFLYFNSRPPNPDDEQASTGTEATDTPSQNETTVASRAAVEPPRADLSSDETIQQDVQAEQVEVTQDQIEDNKIIEQIAETSGGSPIPLTDGKISSSRMVVTSYGREGSAGSVASVNSNPFSSASIGSGNDLQGFENGSIDQGLGTYSQGSTSIIELGFDPQTGIAWGRWNAGSAQFQPASGTAASLPFNNSSLHWVTSPDQPQAIALPSSGSASYQLVGNTSPTDNLGNVGILGQATLNANFNSMTVDPSVAIGINNQVWNGSGSALPISTNGGFSGSLSTVTINNGIDPVFNGSGSAAGFFTNNADGAGMGYALEADINGTNTTVSGTAIFQKN